MSKDINQIENRQKDINISPLLYTVVTWPDVQYLMDKEGFEENSHLINDEKGLDKYGSSAYFVNFAWASAIDPYISLTPEQLKELNDEWEADNQSEFYF